MILPLQRLKILFFFLSLIFFGKLNAQDCEQIGLVSNGILLGEFNCELLIISSDGAQIFQPANLTEELAPGRFIRFSYEILDSTRCSVDVPLINITCLEPFIATDNCSASFLAFPSDFFFSREYIFEPLIYDSTKIYQWDFGDGEQADLAQTTHFYRNSGEFVVCLEVSDEEVCSEKICDTLSVGTPILNTCNFSIESASITDTTGEESFQIEISSQVDFGPNHPETVKWYEYETGKVIGEEAIIFYKPSLTSSPVINICADIMVVYPDGIVCSGTLCHTIIKGLLPIQGCHPLFGYLPHKKPLSTDGQIDFFNLSLGEYTEAIWDFGDGQIITNSSETLSHIYQTPGLYEVCLTLKNDLDVDCQSTICLPVFTIGGTEICTYNDCVLPGDTNKDGLVNIFDVLNLGIGFKTTGQSRPNAVIDPILQAAFDWDLDTNLTLNSKHIDCDGNGTVDILDYVAIDQNYQKVTRKEIIGEVPFAPEVSLNFSTDTLYVNPNQSKISIPASLIIGSANFPIENFYGIALSFDYQGELVASIKTTYDNTSFLGKPDSLITKQKGLTEEKQLGIAITRTNHEGVSGEGKIAEVAFIVEGDIIEGRSTTIQIDLNNLTVVNPSGEEIPVNVSSSEVAVTIIFDENMTVNIEQQLLEQAFSIYPNPTKDKLIISLGEELNLSEGSIEIFNTFGQKVLFRSLSNHQTFLDVSVLETGVYWVRIYTADGIGIKEIVIE